jgi:lipid II:glycine glycyltransferase (peptidoglycan interpeptide bridge formation enzyme)
MDTPVHSLSLRFLSPDGEGASAGNTGPISFLQSEPWGDFKSIYGWKPLRFEFEIDGRSAVLLVLVKRMPAGFCFAYVPHGPALSPREGEGGQLLALLSEALRPYLPRACLFIRFDPPWYEVEKDAVDQEDEAERRSSSPVETRRSLIGAPLRRAAYDVQPPDTVLVDLRPSEESILGLMKPKWRYNIRLAVKKGVVVEEAGPEAIPEFYELYRTTAQRDRIAIHPEDYYRRLFAADAREPRAFDLRLWVARHEGEALAAIITLFYGDEATYLYGASSDEGRNLMPAYALQWAAMRGAKAAGCSRYDLFGIPPNDDPEHPMAGLYRFKTGFGGEIVHRAGSWDYPLLRSAYACFRIAERARAWWFKDFKKRFGRSGKNAS